MLKAGLLESCSWVSLLAPRSEVREVTMGVGRKRERGSGCMCGMGEKERRKKKKEERARGVAPGLESLGWGQGMSGRN